MNDLLSKYNDYLRLVNCVVEYVLSNGSVIKVPYREDAFLHLLGIHKLTDIQLVQFWLDAKNYSVKRKDVIKRIIDERFTDSDIKRSSKYPLIADRYNYFNYENLVSLNYTDAIINYNPKIIGSSLKSDFILFEENPSNEYNHMAIANDSNNSRYIESFFHESSDKYLKNQSIVNIVRFTIWRPDGSILITDTF